MSDTPETDYENIHHRLGWPAFASKLERERDEAREELQQWRDAAKGAENPHPDEVHCACVPLLLGSLALAQKERNEAREQNEEQARLLAMSADREEKLLQQIAPLKSQVSNLQFS